MDTNPSPQPLSVAELPSQKARRPRWLISATIVAGVITLVTGAAIIYWGATQSSAITDYASCVKSGRPVLDSYPAQCVAPNGRHFTQPTPEFYPTQLPVSSITPLPTATRPLVTPSSSPITPLPTTSLQPTPLGTPVPTPTPTPLPTSTTSGIYGTATISPTCPGAQRPGEVCSKPYQGTFNIASTNGASTNFTFTTNTNGQFSLTLPPGQYTITTQSGSAYPIMAPVTVTVPANQVVPVNLSLDSGIR